MKTEAAKLLQKKRRQVLEYWMTNQLSNESLREDLMSNDDLRQQSEELLEELLTAMGSGNVVDIETPTYERIKEILSGISISRAQQGFTPKETGMYVFSLKDAMLQLLREHIKEPQELYEASIAVDKLIDSLGMETFETYIKGREEVILRQTDEITEISTPVIRVWDGILVLPIIGTLDSSRTQVVMESLLQEIVATSSTIAILDISGVPAVDSLVAQHLIKTVSATRLMGAECIISGIRPEIAQTVVHLGIDLSSIVTKATLASALKYALSMLKLDVVRKSQKEKQDFQS